MADELHFDFVACVHRRVKLAQHLEYFGPAEFRRHGTAFGQPFAKFCPGDEQTMLLVVRARAGRSHAAARIAPERPVDLERLRLKRAVRNFVEDAMRVERAVLVADPGMIAADAEM